MIDNINISLPNIGRICRYVLVVKYNVDVVIHKAKGMQLKGEEQSVGVKIIADYN